MTHDPIGDLRRDLVRAARRRHRPWWRRRPALLGILVVLLAAAPATAAITDLWRPDVAPLPPARTTVATAASSAPAACRPSPATVRAGGTTDATPPEGMLRAFGVLRRPRTAKDETLGPARSMVAGRRAAGAVRYLGDDADGEAHYLVPSLIALPARPRTARCPARPAVRTWLLTLASERGGAGTSPYEDLIARGTFGSSGTSDRRSTVTALVPDGIASVTVRYGTDDPRTFPVQGNFVTYRVALPADRFPSSVVWNDGDGKAIKRVH